MLSEGGPDMGGIIQSEGKTYFPLTHPQKRIWYIEKIYTETSLHNIGGTVTVRGLVNFSLLEEAIHVVIQKHEAMRLRFIEYNSEPYQYLHNYERSPLERMDFSLSNNPRAEFNKWVNHVASKPSLLVGEKSLYYFALFKISDNENGYFVKLHHIICDGWSFGIITEQIRTIYLRLLYNDEINVDLEPTYLDYIEQEKKYVQSDRFQKNKRFWCDKFSSTPDSLICFDSGETVGKRKSYEYSSLLSAKIKNFAANHKCSLNTFFVVTTLLYLYKSRQENEMIIGIPVLNRTGQKEKSTVGMFTSTMPFRFCIDEQSTFADIIVAVNKELTNCYFHQRFPYDLLLQELDFRKKGAGKLFDICVNYYNTKLHTEIDNFPTENIEFYNGNQAYSLQLIIKDWSESGSLKLEIDYQLSEYTDEQIDELYYRIENIIGQIIDYPNHPICDLTFLSNYEMEKQLYEFNATNYQYPKNQTIEQLFEQQVEKTPNNIAICRDEYSLTYRELNQQSNQLARLLIDKGIGSESIVAIMTHHSIETVVGILAILKAGGAYLPIDPSYPDDRITYILDESRAGILLTNENVKKITFPGVVIDLNDARIYTGNDTNLGMINTPRDLVYVIYTSGSTGRPKGVMIEHQGLMNYIWWAKEMYANNENAVFPLFTSLAFDLTVTSIFTPLICGGTIMVYQDNQEQFVLYRIMKENKATVIKLTPSHLSLLRDMDCSNSSVKRFIVGGEDLKVTLAMAIHNNFRGNVEIFNEYGPTETVVGCMIRKYEPFMDSRVSVPIGVPAHNVKVYILDKHLKPVPENSIGELYISGDGVARGYLNQAKLTQERFIPNPFVPGLMMYKSGDLAKMKNDEFIYLGRIDHQVKIRGFRIELAEIEKYLIQHESIDNTVVIDRENDNNDKYLCAYIVKRDKVAELSFDMLRDYLKAFLPEHMIPAYFVEIQDIPLSSNGKLDRNLLPAPELRRTTSKHENLPFRNETEEKLLQILSAVLGCLDISLSDNFYDLGGDSIKAIQVASKLIDEGYSVRVKDLLANPVIEHMSSNIKPYVKQQSIHQKVCEGSVRSTPMISWFLVQNFKNPNHYNQSILLQLKRSITAQQIEFIMNELMKHHDSLRLNVDMNNSQLIYTNDKQSQVIVYDLSEDDENEQLNKMSMYGALLKSSFNIYTDVLIKSAIFNLGRNGQRLLLTAHHLVIDGVSWRILLEDFVTLMKCLEDGGNSNLPLKTCSMQSWALELEHLHFESLKEKQYWLSILKNETRIPLDFDQNDDTVLNSCTLTRQLSKEKTTQLLFEANTAYATKSEDLIVSALALAIFNVFSIDDVVIEMESHGREELGENYDLSRTIGWFTSIYPVKLTKALTKGIADQIKLIKEVLRHNPNGGRSFGVLTHLLDEIPAFSQQKRIRFNYLGDFQAAFNNDLFCFAKENTGSEYDSSNHLTSLIDINIFIVDSHLCIHTTFGQKQFKEHTIVHFIDSFVGFLTEIIHHCSSKSGIDFTPSDFETIDISQEELDQLFN